MTICITGGEGFIGKNLKKQLEKKHKVFTVDIKGNPDIEWDLSNSDFPEHLIHLLQHCDIIYHLASGVGVEYVQKERDSFLKALDIDKNILRYLNKKSKIIFASTSEVYGSGTRLFNENDDLSIASPSKGIRGSYATQKIFGEFLFMNLENPYTIVRFFNIIGKEQNPEIGMVYPRFLEAAKNNKPLTIYGDGNDMRVYCSIKDSTNVLELLISEMDGEILNIGAWNPLTTLSLAQSIIKYTGSSSKIVFESARKEEIHTRQPDLTKLYSIYEPKYKLKDIIKENH